MSFLDTVVRRCIDQDQPEILRTFKQMGSYLTYSISDKITLSQNGTELKFPDPSALQYAIITGRVKCLKVLLGLIDKSNEDNILNVINPLYTNTKYTAINLAIITHQNEILKCLLSFLKECPGGLLKRQLAQKTITNHEIPLQFAAHHKNFEAFNILLKEYDDLNDTDPGAPVLLTVLINDAENFEKYVDLNLINSPKYSDWIKNFFTDKHPGKSLGLDDDSTILDYLENSGPTQMKNKFLELQGKYVPYQEPQICRNEVRQNQESFQPASADIQEPEIVGSCFKCQCTCIESFELCSNCEKLFCPRCMLLHKHK